jgi:hypothetical protein
VSSLDPFDLHGRIRSSAADAITLYLLSAGGVLAVADVGSAASADIVGADVVDIVCGRWMIGVRSIVSGAHTCRLIHCRHDSAPPRRCG